MSARNCGGNPRLDTLKFISDQARTLDALLAVVHILDFHHQEGALATCAALASDVLSGIADIDLSRGAA